ncbi:unnamed protein product [Thlaspi arvense]|uniref:non-specific serine/threonine protein kinase n=1 Tax=Thlaspi arvense TaxID=13288 RepID=A0AAU9S015_THLAR|nr:unnamed protein product [Thlaspi arvense]
MAARNLSNKDYASNHQSDRIDKSLVFKICQTDFCKWVYFANPRNKELVNATNGFSQENLLGEGEFGCAYKGYYLMGRVVAVKHLKIGEGQGDHEFKSEVETLSIIHHRHLVSIMGHCISGDGRLLIYDYVSNIDLYFHLHSSKEVLDWATRVKIAASAAVDYLISMKIVICISYTETLSHLTFLEDIFDARVSGFGLARLALDWNTHTITRVIGTIAL